MSKVKSKRVSALLATIGLSAGLLGLTSLASAGPCDRLPAGKEFNDCWAKQWQEFVDRTKMNNPPAPSSGISDNSAKAQSPVLVPSGPSAPNYNAYLACVSAHEGSLGTVNAQAHCGLDGKFRP
jgi:hypothetical protein